MTGDRPRFGPLHNTPRWYLVLAVAWSAVVLSLPWIVVATMGERLPDPVASHWGADGVPDGFTPLATAWVWPAVIGLLLVALLLGLGMAMRQLRSIDAPRARHVDAVGGASGALGWRSEAPTGGGRASSPIHTRSSR